MRILHCSDFHVLTHYAGIPWRQLGWRRLPALAELYIHKRGEHFAYAKPNVSRLVEAALTLQVDHMVVSGDLTGYAMEEEFAEAAKLLEGWGLSPSRLTVVPGNHDCYARDSYALFAKHFGVLLQSDMPEYAKEGPFPLVHLLGEEAAIVGLKSSRLPFLPGASFGYLGRAQREGLEALLEDTRLQGRWVGLVVHHAPLNPKAKPDKPHHAFYGAQHLLRRLASPQYALLHGHIHHRYMHPSTPSRPALFCAGSSTWRGREGYWLLDIKGGRLHSFAEHTLPALGET
ncbi:MAG: metallophosphoesterase [Proteobacteria bacterium]|nr:metallophosphoesterase [Cystobacterineae bacterium]MCL2259703.1 metallophosphoesterase [Cystobacterineae bacterium]MCL2313697.1 metallophosphoesterase [Pseudomonadota bacterium]